jgi:hypothetical protein
MKTTDTGTRVDSFPGYEVDVPRPDGSWAHGMVVREFPDGICAVVFHDNERGLVEKALPKVRLRPSSRPPRLSS